MAGAVLLVAFITVGAAVQVLNVGFGLWFTEVFLFLGVPWVLLRLSGRLPVEATGLSRLQVGPALVGLAAGAVNFFAAVVPLQFLSTSLAPDSMRLMFDQARVFEQLEPWELWAVLGGVTLAAPVCEEFFFRGVLQPGLFDAAGARGALRPLLLTSFLFSLFHFDPVGFLARWELGLLFGWLAWRSGSLWPGILAHAANNGVSSALFLLGRGREEESLRWPLVVGMAAVGAAVFTSLLRWALSHPGWWPGPATEHPAVARPRSGPRLALPWLAAAAVSSVALVGLDPRGVRLNLLDLTGERLAPLPKDAPADLKAARAELAEVRKKARHGELPLEAYGAARKARVEAEDAPPVP